MLKPFIFSFICITLVSFSAFSQVDNRELYMRKIESYSKLKRIGTTSAIAGVGAVVVGSIMISNAELETRYYPNGTAYTVQTGGPNLESSILFVIAGISAAVPGTILGLIGNKKSK